MDSSLYNYKLLAEIRAASMTQEQLAKMMDISPITLSRIENGRGGSYRLIRSVCEALGVDSSKIFYSSKQAVKNN